jgi:4-amino-4-deoxy-L-arabinose transferase-like glycosyltransferase
MNRARRDVLGLFVLSLVVRLTTAAFVPRPGYMDTAYYAAGAVRLAQGGGLSEQFLWNYLDDPAGLPHPGFLYWMPLPSVLAAPFAALFPASFFALQFPFAILSTLLPLVAYGLAWGISGRRRSAWLAGLIVLFSGFFFPYWTLLETFAPYALFGSLALWLAGTWKPDAGNGVKGTSRWLLVGLLVGLAHLTRADGILLLPVVVLAPLISHLSRNTQHETRNTHTARRFLFRHLSFTVLGYLLVMAPWFARNLTVIGAPLSPAGPRTLWLRTYDDLFCYRCDVSLRSYLAWGCADILRSKLWAMRVNFERFLAEDCLVFLLPFVLMGLSRLRRRPPFILSTLYLVLIYLAHTLAFTFPGPRGGFFHASAPTLPFLVAAGVEGVEAAVGWAARRRRWDLRQAQLVFGVATVVLAALLSVYATVQKLPAWRRVDTVYEEIGQWLAQGNMVGEAVMVANPAAFWYYTGHPAVVVPNGGAEAVLAVADRYGVRHVLLDRNRPAPLAGLYLEEMRHPRLRPVMTWGEGETRVVLYAVQ